MSSVHRVDYTGDGLSEDDLAPTPWQQARLWVDEADARGRDGDDVPEPRALSVATVDASGAPNVRTVLMRFFDERGPGFVTSVDSTKGVELAQNPHIAAALTWPSMFRSIRFRGVAEPLDDAEVQEYWSSRPWGSRISAWASRQSEPATGRQQLEDAVEQYAAQFPDHGKPDDVPLPAFWSGYRVRCREVEFWGGRRNRLHDRLVFSAVGSGGGAAAQDVDLRPGLDDPAAWTVFRRQP
ncbi:MAG: pyridoxamine 5'-phosphate oxidase [Lapillicoccus sp.]